MSTALEVREHNTLEAAVAAYERGDHAEALRVFRHLADDGEVTAQFYLGRMYARGEAVKQNDAEAALWYGKAAEKGCHKAQHNLGMMYLSGQACAAGSLFKRKMDPAVGGTGQRLVATCPRKRLLAGVGVLQNLAKAASWYRKATEQGNADAEYALGRMYLDGYGVPGDLSAAERLIRSAAERGNIKAQCSLATMYTNGEGVPQDYSQALTWYRKGADFRRPRCSSRARPPI